MEQDNRHFRAFPVTFIMYEPGRIPPLNFTEIARKLRELRRYSCLSQDQVSLRSGVGVKTLSSFETGARTSTMKVCQLRQILAVYGITEKEFFGRSVETLSAMMEDKFVEEHGL